MLLHGTGSGNFSWRGLLPTLAQHFTVVAPDLPGQAPPSITAVPVSQASPS
ncbi:alpha/beta fold hydrolase [Limnohabitans sp.]|uniref:alpha/beta fold hydrolase n=1 Tax=Limnohabitans sp. TaxID=1907725 RepID=UPI003BAEF402